jgi:hypothetical protein
MHWHTYQALNEEHLGSLRREAFRERLARDAVAPRRRAAAAVRIGEALRHWVGRRPAAPASACCDAAVPNHTGCD